MRLSVGLLAVAIAAMSLLGCAGWSGTEPNASSPADEAMTCDQVRAERRMIGQRLGELENELAAGPNGGAAFGTASRIAALDETQSLERQVELGQARFQVLDRLAAERCSGS